MSLRVTSATISRSTMVGLQANLARLQRTQEQLSSGRKINRMSDSPVDASAAMRLRAEQGQTTQVGKNIDDGLNRLGAADNAFGQISTMMNRVRQLLVSGMNATNGDTERQAMVTEIDQLRAGMIDQANTQYLGQSVFGGTAAVANAFDPSTGAYQGNQAVLMRAVSADSASQLEVSVTGDAAFTTLFNAGGGAGAGTGILADISTALKSTDPATRTDQLNQALKNLDDAAAAMQNARSLVGARTNRLTTAQSASETHLDSVTASLTTAESIDLPKTIIDMQTQQNAYQAALGAAAKIIQPSLLDFLR